MAVDLAIVHLAGIGALFGTFALHLLTNELVSRNFLFYILRVEYLDQFWLLSLVLPSVFFFAGFYTRTRGYATMYKWWSILRGTLIASLIYIAASVLVGQASVLPRSALILLPLLVMIGVLGVRVLNFWLEKRSIVKISAVGRQSPAVASTPILVVGGAGYIGAIVIRKLLERNHTVRCLDNLAYGDRAIRELLENPRLELIEGDCRNIHDVVRAMSDIKSVIHLAAIVGDPACAADDKNALEINYSATRMMVEIAKGHGVERFIFSSSCSVYGASDLLMDEHSTTVPVSLYGETKINSEKVLLEAASGSFHPIILRFATVFGLAPRPRFDLVVNLLTAKAFKEGVITIFNGEQWRPFIYVADIAEAVCRTLEAPLERVSGEIFNVGDDRQNHTLSQIADLIREEFPNTRVEQVDNADRRNYRVSFQKIRERIGFECSVSVRDGIRELHAAFERKDILDYKEPFYSNLGHLKTYGGFDSKHELDAKVMAAFANS